MDVQFVDENSKHRNTMQHDELEEVLDYAERWSEICNNKEKNIRVNNVVKSMRRSIAAWSPRR